MTQRKVKERSKIQSKVDVEVATSVQRATLFVLTESDPGSIELVA